MRARNAIVIGGGIAGLASAISLHRNGWSVRVLEQADAFREVGAGILLWPNALRALDQLGLGHEVRKLGAVESAPGIRHKDGRWLFRTDIHAIEKMYGPSILIHRADLIDILVNALPGHILTLSAKTTNISIHEAGVTVKHARGTDEADLLVAADGIHSLTRTKFWPEAKPPQYAGYTAWRFVTPKLGIEPETSETWGNGERVGIIPFNDGRVYGYLTASVPRGGQSENELSALERRFGSWHEPIPTVLASVEPGAIVRDDIYALPALETYVKDRIVLVGDAAHAMTPDLGEGGGTALEDAVDLARVLANASDLERGLWEFDAIRRPRTQTIARKSAQLGRIGQWSWPPAVALRNTMIRLMPSALFLKSLEPTLNWGMPDR